MVYKIASRGKTKKYVCINKTKLKLVFQKIYTFLSLLWKIENRAHVYMLKFEEIIFMEVVVTMSPRSSTNTSIRPRHCAAGKKYASLMTAHWLLNLKSVFQNVAFLFDPFSANRVSGFAKTGTTLNLKEDLDFFCSNSSNSSIVLIKVLMM